MLGPAEGYDLLVLAVFDRIPDDEANGGRYGGEVERLTDRIFTAGGAPNR